MTTNVSTNMADFKIKSDFQPQGDQPEAIRRLVDGLEQGKRFQTLLGVTGSGKTFTMANVIARIAKPTLVMSHNKTLAAQLYEEFKELFPITPSSISSAITTTTSPKPTSPSGTSTSKKTPRETRNSTV